MRSWRRTTKKMFIKIALNQIKPDDFIKEYRSLVDELVTCQKRLKNPVSLKGGKPLAKSGIIKFQMRIETIEKQLKGYRIILKWLQMCGYFPGGQSELLIEQEILRHFLRDYAYVDKRHLGCIREHGTQEYWKNRVEHYKK